MKPDVTPKPLSKSQFKLGLSCIQKLRHYRAGLPSNLVDNDLMRLLAEGGGAIEALQRAVEKPFWIGPSGGREVAQDSLNRVKDAAKEVIDSAGRRSLYEVTIVQDGFLARIDLLRLYPNRIELVEIKSKSWSGPDEGRALGEIVTKGKGKTPAVVSEWVPYLQDLAFQHEVMKRWWCSNAVQFGMSPDIEIVPKLLLVKSGGVASEFDCLKNFQTIFETHGGHRRAKVEHRNPAIKKTDLLTEVDATFAVNLIVASVQAKDGGFAGLGLIKAMEHMASIVSTNAWPSARGSLGNLCKRCEYRSPENDRSGVVQCWGGDVDAAPFHILKLAYLNTNQVKKAIGVGRPIDAKLTSLVEDDLQDRQQDQWRWACLSRNRIAPELVRDRFGSLQAPESVPIYFLDFETARYPIPYREGGKANELVPFQFEGHLLPCREAALSERRLLPGFLELTDPDPRRGILRALRAQFGATGPIYHWHHYERYVLDVIKRSIEDDPGKADDDQELIAFCDSFVRRLVDLKEIAMKHVTLNATDGSYSIKRVLPVIWSDPVLRRAFAPGAAKGDPNYYEDPVDPYKSLAGLEADFLESLGQQLVEALMDEGGESEAIRNGGLAMVYYHYVRLFGMHERREIQQQFRQYCQLDSAAMVMAYDYLRRIQPAQ